MASIWYTVNILDLSVISGTNSNGHLPQAAPADTSTSPTCTGHPSSPLPVPNLTGSLGIPTFESRMSVYRITMLCLGKAASARELLIYKTKRCFLHLVPSF